MAAVKVFHEGLFTELRATERNHSDIAFGAGHLIGTTAMGADPTHSVVDGNGRAHDVSTLRGGKFGVLDGGDGEPDIDAGGARLTLSGRAAP